MRRPTFDYEVAVKLREDGWTLREIAEAIGVSQETIRLAINPEYRAQKRAEEGAWQRNGTCPECGGRSCRNRVRTYRCPDCAKKAREAQKIQTVREDGYLRCARCKEFKPPTEFTRSAAEPGRGFKRKHCRACTAEARRLYSQRLKETDPEKYAAQLERNRERRQRSRQAATSA